MVISFEQKKLLFQTMKNETQRLICALTLLDEGAPPAKTAVLNKEHH
jgi:hypothetical protein